MSPRVFVAAFLILFACSRPLASAIAGHAHASPATLATVDEDVREATFRWMFKKNASGAQQNARVFCIHFERGADPPAPFVARFSSSAIRVVPGSKCTEDARSGVVERATGAHGLAFRIDSVKLVDATHASVTGGYYEAGLSASGNVYTLERIQGVWTVTKDEMQWIS